MACSDTKCFQVDPGTQSFNIAKPPYLVMTVVCVPGYGRYVEIRREEIRQENPQNSGSYLDNNREADIVPSPEDSVINVLLVVSTNADFLSLDRFKLRIETFLRERMNSRRGHVNS